MCVISPSDLEVVFKTVLVDLLDGAFDNQFKFFFGSVVKEIVGVGKECNHSSVLDLLEETSFGVVAFNGVIDSVDATSKAIVATSDRCWRR